MYILRVIENGYKITFKHVPIEADLKHNTYARNNVISEVKEKPKVINPLTVAYYRSGKPRLVFDCRHINPCKHLFKVKFEV